MAKVAQHIQEAYLSVPNLSVPLALASIEGSGLGEK